MFKKIRSYLKVIFIIPSLVDALEGIYKLIVASLPKGNDEADSK